MKIYKNELVIFVALLSIFLISVSCDENFSPFGDLKDRFALNCIINLDSTTHYATLTRSYLTEDMNPYSNISNQNIGGRLIRIFNGENYIVLKDTIVQRPIPSEYKIPYNLYVAKKFTPDAASPIEIEAFLPNGKTLISKTKPPNKINFGYKEKFIPSKTNKDIIFSWFPEDAQSTYLCQMAIHYFKLINAEIQEKTFIIPMDYIKLNDQIVPVYSHSSAGYQYSTSLSTISKAMSSLSEGDNNKSSYLIIDVIFEIYSFDKNMSEYFISSTNGNNEYSVNPDINDFTNIKGGLGVFGSFRKDKAILGVTHNFIKSFGYSTASPDVINVN